jgi:long-subunit fatty acid transport protein
MRTLLAVTLLWPALTLAGGFATPNPDARSLGLAQAGVADQTGPEAISMNSAGLAGPQGLALTGSLQMIDNHTAWSDPALGSAKTATHPAFPPLLAASYGATLPNGMAWGAGIGLLSVGGGSLHWPQNWPGQFHIETVSQQVLQARAAVALEPVKGIKVGAGGIYYRATEELSQAMDFAGQVAHAKVGVAGGAPGFLLSLEAGLPSLPVKFGADYRSQGKITATGKAHFSGVPAAFLTQRLLDQGATTEMVVPPELNLGLSWQATPHLQVLVGWTLEGWHVYKADDFLGDKGFTVSVKRNYRDAYDYRLGVEYAGDPALRGWSLRAGVFRSISDQPTDTISPSLSDASGWNGALGVGYQVTRALRVDLGYQYTRFDAVTSSGPDALPGTYKTTANLVALGLSWRAN